MEFLREFQFASKRLYTLRVPFLSRPLPFLCYHRGSPPLRPSMNHPVLESRCPVDKYRSENVFLPSLQHPSTARALYEEHRKTRSAAQRALLLDPAIPLAVDRELSDILRTDPPDWSLDARHNLSVWTRPSAEVKALATRVQDQLRDVVGEHNGTRKF